jgi:hypothetical protein
MEDTVDELSDLLKEREELTDRLAKALQHFTIKQQLHILSGFIPIDKLRIIVDFQERKTNG